MKIGIDIVDVVVEFVIPFLKTYEKDSGKKYKIDDIFTYDLWKPLSISKEKAIAIADQFYDSESFENSIPIEGTKEFIENVSKNYDVSFITARPLKLKESTKIFIKKYFPEKQFKIFHTGDFFDQGKTKLDVCKDENISIMIEDNYKYAKYYAEKGIKVFLFDKPWNQNQEGHENIIRVKNWKEVLENLR